MLQDSMILRPLRGLHKAKPLRLSLSVFARLGAGFEGSGFFCDVVLALFLEERFEDVVVELLEHAADGFEVVITVGEGAEVEGAADAAHARVGESVVNFTDAGDDERAGAHRAGLFRYVKGAFVESPIADKTSRLRDCENFGVGGGVIGGAGLIVRGGDDLPLVFDHCADGHFVLFPCFDRLVVGVRHEVFGIALQGGWVDFFEWAVYLHGVMGGNGGRFGVSEKVTEM